MNLVSSLTAKAHRIALEDGNYRALDIFEERVVVPITVSNASPRENLQDSDTEEQIATSRVILAHYRGSRGFRNPRYPSFEWS